jgi:Integrase core domain
MALAKLEALSNELGNPGVAALWIAAKRAKLELTRKAVAQWVATRSEKQVLGAPQKAAGKSVSENNNRWQMDLIDVTNVSAGGSKFFLVCVNVFDRYMYARALPNKEPLTVAENLVPILGQAEKTPQIISSDNGAEFRGKGMNMVMSRFKITQKFKDAGDMNGLGLIDRQIGLLKRKLAELAASRRKNWTELLPVAVKALNATPKPGVLHGAAPEDVRDSDAVKFMLMQDQAKNIEHNKKLNDRRTKALEATKTFRPQLEIEKFKRTHQATYGNPEKAATISAGRVTTRTGESYALKQIRVVPVGAEEVGKDERRAVGAAILDALERALADFRVLGGQGGSLALTKVADILKEQLEKEGRDYNRILKRTGGKLIDLIKSDDRFRIIERAHGQHVRYFVSLK